jgi:hypothetical protein
MQVDHAVERVVVVLQRDPLPQRPQVVAEMDESAVGCIPDRTRGRESAGIRRFYEFRFAVRRVVTDRSRSLHRVLGRRPLGDSVSGGTQLPVLGRLCDLVAEGVRRVGAEDPHLDREEVQLLQRRREPRLVGWPSTSA